VKHFKYLLLDIEGTIVLDKLYTPVRDSVKWFNALKSKGIQSRLVTNNTTESPDDLFAILKNKGFRLSKDDYFTCLTEAVTLMKRRNIKSCLALTKPAVKRYLKSKGIKPLDSPRAESILVGYDPKLNYQKMNMAVSAIVENQAVLFTLHRNRRFMNEKRQIAMSSGPITAALENASMTRAVVCGKPSRRFFLDSIKGWDIPRDEILMVSDDPFADLIGAKKLGMSTCWVLTGSVRDKKVIDKIPPAFKPDFTFNSVLEIPT
jgi:HAD superfamily hydrolase (TIGR01450 family)